MLARLSVFPGSFNAEGAAAVGKAPSQVLPRRIAVMLEDMRSCAVLEAALPACSAPSSQPAASQPAAAGLLAPRYKMPSLIREVSQDLLKKREGAGLQEAQLAFVEWMLQQAQQFRDVLPDSGQSSPCTKQFSSLLKLSKCQGLLAGKIMSSQQSGIRWRRSGWRHRTPWTSFSPTRNGTTTLGPTIVLPSRLTLIRKTTMWRRLAGTSFLLCDGDD